MKSLRNNREVKDAQAKFIPETLAPTLIFDNGSYLFKAGHASSLEPTVIFSSTVGHSKIDVKESYVGDKAQNLREIDISHPIENGMVRNWEDLETIWNHTLYNELQVIPSEYSIILSEPPFTSKKGEEKMVQLMFEKFESPAVALANPALLALYASGKLSGIVVESGYDFTSIIPVIEGVVQHYGITRLEIAGKKLTDSLSKVLAEKGYYLEQKEVEKIKEQCCYVANDYQLEIMGSVLNSLGIDTREYPEYQSSNGQKVQIGKDSFACPEAIFNPSLLGIESIGLSEAINNSIMKSKANFTFHKRISDHEKFKKFPNEYIARAPYRTNVILSGGSSMFPGMAERISRDLSIMAPSTTEITMCARSDRNYSTWIGASILASTAWSSNRSMQEMKENIWISKAEYEESGPGIITRKIVK